MFGALPLAVQHDRLPVAADVRQQLDALRTVHERLRVVARRENVVVAGFGHHQLVADVARRAREQMPALGLEYAGIAIPGSGKLRRRLPQPRGGGEIGHRSILSCVNQPTQPNNPGRFGTVWSMAPGPLC